MTQLIYVTGHRPENGLGARFQKVLLAVASTENYIFR